MEFDYMNDIHLDFWVRFDKNQIKFEKRTREFTNSLIPKQKSKILVIGGDIGHYNRQGYWFLDEVSKFYDKVLIVFGNHDYYLISNHQAKKYGKSSVNEHSPHLEQSS